MKLSALLNRITLSAVLLTGASSMAIGTDTLPSDPFLVQAFEGVWRMERHSVSLLSEDFDIRESSSRSSYTPNHDDKPTYQLESGDQAFVEYQRRRYSATNTPWGPFPPMAAESLRLVEFRIPENRYIAISGQGRGLFQLGDWQRFRFLHVLDVSRRHRNVTYYPLIAEANLGERVVGRLPGSAYLNYARLVPARWDLDRSVTGYEVLLYALEPGGLERVIEDEKPLSYLLTRDPNRRSWSLSRSNATPVADTLDRADHAFTAGPAALPVQNGIWSHSPDSPEVAQ